MSQSGGQSLKVLEAYTRDVGRGVARIDYDSMDVLGASTGDVIEIKTYFTDNGTTQDYYLFKFKPTYTAIPIYFAQEDISFQGNQIFGLYRNRNVLYVKGI